jgi:hypothetical protein
MQGVKSLEIHLVPPRTWHPLFEHPPEGTTPTGAFVRESTLALHNRHIGVTPKLMAELAPALLDARYRLPEESTWGIVFARLARALVNPDDDAPASSKLEHRSGLLFSRTPVYTLLRVVAPLINEASRRIGSCCLFCGDEMDATIDAVQYEAYTVALAGELTQMARAENHDTLELFWRERALTLSSLSRQQAGDGAGSSLPDPDPVALGLLLRLRPEYGEGEEEKKLRKLTTLRRQRSTRQREEGVAGIRVTRREEELGSALISEFFNDSITRADRFFNTGFLSLEREPKRTKFRDLLIVGMLPGDLEGVNGDFIKACWFDFIMRLGLILHRMGLQQTEFRWIEGRGTGQMRSCAFLLQEMPEIFSHYEGRPSNRYRQGFLDALHWLPRFLDSRGHYIALPEYGQQAETARKSPNGAPPETEHGQAPEAHRWILAAWAAQQEAAGWQRSGVRSSAGAGEVSRSAAQASAPGHSNPGRLRADEFTYVHLMTFLSAPELEMSRTENEMAARSLVARLTGQLHARNRFRGNASITWIPDQLDKSAAWRIDASHLIRARLYPDEEPELTLSRLAGKLEQIWLQAIIAEVTRV